MNARLKAAAKPDAKPVEDSAARVAPAPQRDAADVREAEGMAREVLSHYLGAAPDQLKHQASGLSNFVFEAQHPDGLFMVRLCPDATKLAAFMKEQWAMRRAREAGVPVPEILEVGTTAVPMPYMVSRRVEGREATTHPARLSILHELGEHAARINAIRTRGFGSTFDWSENKLSRRATWGDYLRDELCVEGRIETLERHRMLDATQLRALRRTIGEAQRMTVRPCLNHGDLRLKNTIVDEAGCITAILDWENCTSNAAPAWELSLALHDLSIDEKQAFLAGYGIKEAKLVEIAPLMRALNLVNYAPHVAQLAAEKDRVRLAQYRTRLSGALDLYAL